MKNDQELVNKIRRGDKEAFSLLVKALIVEAIEETDQDYLHSEKVKNIIKNDQYEINIYRNKGKKLN
ncbi:hypothetical protein [Peribacillus butanolivorans]|uniref:hypothetical protein n=1 Tax=Peribacillus butanolivorans TaxID=421767 RepID=UPI00365A2279